MVAESSEVGDSVAEQCPCGLPLHYTNRVTQQVIQSFIRTLGETILIQTPAGAWNVPRHYIALHGIKAEILPTLAAHYGWARVTPQS